MIDVEASDSYLCFKISVNLFLYEVAYPLACTVKLVLLDL